MVLVPALLWLWVQQGDASPAQLTPTSVASPVPVRQARQDHLDCGHPRQAVPRPAGEWLCQVSGKLVVAATCRGEGGTQASRQREAEGQGPAPHRVHMLGACWDAAA